MGLENVFFTCFAPKLAEGIKNLLKKIGVINNFDFNSTNVFYFIEDNRVKLIPRHGQEETELRNSRSYVDFNTLERILLKEIESKNNWYLDLKVGDSVTIGKRVGHDFDYPFSFIKEMAEHEGETFKIKEIISSYAPANSYERFFNGDTNAYILDGIDFTWHSSMFVPTTPIKIKTIEISELSIISKLLNH